MGKKTGQRRVITYNLSAASARAAFEEGLDANEFDYGDELEAHTQSTQLQARVLKQRNERAAQSAFLPDMHDSRGASGSGAGSGAVAAAAGLTIQQHTQLMDLVELFGTHHTPDLIHDVYRSCGMSFEGAIQILSDMTAAVEASQPAAADSATAGPSSAGPSGSVGPTQDVTAGTTDVSDDVCWWDLLHESLREAVLSHLSTRDLARVAWTCRDFAKRVRKGRNDARTLVIPTGVSLSSVVGMVAGHPNARSISLVRWGSSNLRDGDYIALLRAIGKGAQSTRRNVPVEAFSLRGWTQASNSNVLTLLDEFSHLRELDLSDCDNITDAALGPIARYQRIPTDTDTALTNQTSLTTATTSPGPSSAAAAAAGIARRASSPANATPPQASLTSPSPPPPMLITSPSGGSIGNKTGAVSVPTAQHGATVGAVGGAIDGPDSEDSDVYGMSDSSDSEVDNEDGVLLDEDIAAHEEKRKKRDKKRAQKRAQEGSQGDLGSVALRGSGSATAASGIGGIPPLPRAPSGTPPPAAASVPRTPSWVGSAPRGTPPPAAAAAAPRSGASILGTSPGSAFVLGSHSHHSRGASGGIGGILGSSPGGFASSLYGASPPAGLSSSPSPSPSLMGSSLGRAGGSGVAGGSVGSLGRTLFALRSFGGTPGAAAAATQQRGLEVLCLAGCSRLSTDAIRALVAAQLVKQCLVALDVSRCIGVKRSVFALPPSTSLRVLKAAGCLNLDEVVMQLPASCPLQELWLNNCRRLSKVQVSAPKLVLLHIGGCKSLTGLSLRCPKLTQLLANLCTRLSDIEAEDVSVPALEELNFFGCRQLTTTSLLAVTATCQGLQLLNVNGCTLIHEVNVSGHSQLRVLDVTGCKMLLTVRCASTALTTVTGRGCNRLVTLELDGCTGLQLLDLTNCGSLRNVHLPALTAALTALQAQPELSNVLSPGWVRSPAGQAAQARVIAGALQLVSVSLHASSTVAPLSRLAGCDGLPALTTLGLKVLRQRHQQQQQQQAK